MMTGPHCTLLLLMLMDPQPPAQDREVPVTIKELDVEGAIREFQGFQQELERHRQRIAEDQSTAQETGQILEDLKQTANEENNFNETQILGAIQGYVDGVVTHQVELVDFLESQRYRISYYAKQMAASVAPEDLFLLFGTTEQNQEAVSNQVHAVREAQQAIAEFVDRLPAGQFDRGSFRPTGSMPEAQRRQLDALVFRYQREQGAQELAKSRLRLVLQMQRTSASTQPTGPEIDPDLLLGQMFGALERVRLQMAADLLSLEAFLDRYAKSTRTQEILGAFQKLVELQGGLAGPSPGLASMLDWLQTSSFRRLTLSVENLGRPGISFPRSSDLIREAYQAARSPMGGTREDGP